MIVTISLFSDNLLTYSAFRKQKHSRLVHRKTQPFPLLCIVTLLKTQPDGKLLNNS